MIANIKLENFKSFKKIESLKIKPITILCGVNSCGKSSILQSLLLLKQTKESRTSNKTLLFNGKYVHLGDIKNIVHGKNKEDEITLSYEYKLTTHQFHSTKKNRKRAPNFPYLRYLLTDENYRMKNAVHKMILSASLKVSDESKGYIKTAEITKYKCLISTIDTFGNEHEGSSLIIQKDENDYSIKWKNISGFNHGNSDLESGESNGMSVDFENLSPIIEFKKSSMKDVSINKAPYFLMNFITMFNAFIINANEDITYIGPLREEPSRRYIYENEVLEIGTKGENAAYIYQTEQECKIDKHYFLNENEDEFLLQSQTISLNKALGKWLDIMKIKGFKPDFQSEIIRLNMNSNSCINTKVNIADVGFGVSQIFPILLEGLRMNANGTLLLEQPEIHLHPNLQMQMADYFISLSLSNKNVIVETHSEHIINRLVRRIIEDESDIIGKNIAIYFISNSETGSTIEEVVIDPNHGITNWPDGFFDQTANEQQKIILAGIKKRKNARSMVSI